MKYSLLFFALCLHLVFNAQTVTYTSVPARLQLYCRNSKDSATVKIAGTLSTLGYDSAMVRVYRNNVLWQYQNQKLTYGIGSALFSLAPKIFADTVEYKFEILFRTGATVNVHKTVDSVVCGDAFLLDGQSNTMASAGNVASKNQFLRSFGVQTDWTDYNAADTSWGLASAINPVPYGVGAWGYRMMQMIKDTFKVPVCIINGAGNGSAVELHKRNNLNPMDLKTFYGRLLYRATKAKVASGVKGVLWHQGEANSGFAGNYYKDFKTVYTAWREDYPSIKKIFIFQIRPGCGSETVPNINASEVREIQRWIPDSLADMGVMTTIGLPGFGSDFCHFTTAGYRVMGEWMFRLVARDIYGKTYPYDVTPANVKKIFFTTDQKNEIAILLRNNQHVIWRPDSFLYGTTNYTKDYFYLDGKSGAVTDGRSNKDTLFLTLSASSSAKTLTYLPDLFCNGSTTSTYIGPFLYGQNGVAMLSFDKVPISCINNDFPLLKNKTVNVNKYTAVGTTIDTLKATDPDGNTIYYSIVSGDPDHVFSLDSATGILKLVKNLKYYTYALVIRARDNGTCNLEASASYNVITFTTALGENNQSIEIYPNPATDLLNIRSGSSSVSATAVITDITGKILLSETLVSDVESIDVSGLESGLYLVRVSSQKETSTISFLKK